MDLHTLADALNDCLDDLAWLAVHHNDAAKQQVLLIHAGRLIAQAQEQLDTLDYGFVLLVCEIDAHMAEQYKQIYLSSMSERVEAA